MITPETIQRIKDACHIEEVIGEFLMLRRRGTNYTACCPFHNERTPSFNVNPARNIFKCFGCGKSGDSISFLMEYQHLTYPEALRFLASKYNIEVEEEELSPEVKAMQYERDSMRHLVEFAQKYYADQLLSADNSALRFFADHSISKETLLQFGIGLAPQGGNTFVSHALASGYSEAMLFKTGLALQTEESGLADAFVDRIIFPYSDAQHASGFAALSLSEGNYIFSPASLLFKPVSTFYGLTLSKGTVIKEDCCYMVADAFEVVSVAQSGISNVITPFSQPISDDQIRQLSRFSRNVTFLYPIATPYLHEAAKRLLLSGLHVRVVLVPGGITADAYARQNGSTALQDLAKEKPQNYVFFRINQLVQSMGSSMTQRNEAIREMLTLLRFVSDELERNEYLGYCAQVLDLPEQTLRYELSRLN